VGKRKNNQQAVKGFYSSYHEAFEAKIALLRSLYIPVALPPLSRLDCVLSLHFYLAQSFYNNFAMICLIPWLLAPDSDR